MGESVRVGWEWGEERKMRVKRAVREGKVRVRFDIDVGRTERYTGHNGVTGRGVTRNEDGGYHEKTFPIALQGHEAV